MKPCPSFNHLVSRLRTLALTCPPETALFYARLWHAICPPSVDDHECLHVLALCHIQVGNIYTAIGYVRDVAEPISDFADHNLVLGCRSSQGCMACAMIVGQCCDSLGRFNEGKEVIETAFRTCPSSCKPLNMISPPRQPLIEQSPQH
jgi:anaphase-promoting complex subunit 3